MSNQELIELAKLSQATFFNRRAMEWQLLLGYWTGIALTTAAVLSGSFSLPMWVRFALIAALWILLLVVWFFCIEPIQVGHAIDQAFYIYFTKRVEGASPDRPVAKNVKLNMRWFIGQVLFSALLTFIASVLIGSHMPTEKPASNQATEASPGARLP